MTAVVGIPEMSGIGATRGLGVSTVSADSLRASIQVEGGITSRTCPLLLGVISTHSRAGRRHLRLDLAAAELAEESVLPHLLEAHLGLQRVGGMLLFDNADPAMAGLLRAAGLMVVPAG